MVCRRGGIFLWEVMGIYGGYSSLLVWVDGWVGGGGLSVVDGGVRGGGKMRRVRGW